MKRLHMRLFRATLRLYPLRFRQLYGLEMVELFEALVEDARRTHGRLGVVITTLRSLGATPAGAASAWSLKWGERRAGRMSRRKGDGTMMTFVHELRDAVQGLRQNRAFALMAVGSLALGMSANATMLTLVRGLVWSELPVPGADRLVRVFEQDPRGPRNFSYPNYLDVREQGSQVFEGTLVHDLSTFGLRAGDQTRVVHGELVSANYFEVLAIRAAVGRLFTQRDADSPGTVPLVVISHYLWETRFGGDPSTVGQVVELSGVPVQILGVAPRSFQGTKLGLGMDLWVPLRPWARAQGLSALEEQRQSRWLNVVARLRPGIGIGEAQAALDTIAGRLAVQYPDTNRNTRFAVTTEAAGSFGGEGKRLTSTIGGVTLLAAGLVLLVACGNVAALLLARGAKRQQEMAVRRALGASRWRILRHFLAESLVLASAATGLGLVLARLASPLLLFALPPLPYRFAVQTTPDGDVLSLMAVAGLLTALACGMTPALRAASGDALPGLLPGRRLASAPSRLRPLVALSGLTLAFCCVTLVLSGLFARSLRAAHAVEPGFATRARAMASIDVGLAGPDASAPDQFFEVLLEQLVRRPGVRSAAVASNLPLTDRQSTVDVFVAGGPTSPDETGIEAWVASVSEDYFQVLGQPLLAGRSFEVTDREGPLVVIVSRALAQRLAPSTEALGRRISFGRTDAEVVGIAPDVPYGMISESPRPALYLPFWRNAPQRAEVVVHGDAGDPTLPSAIAAVTRAVDPHVPVFGAKALGVHVDGSLWMFRLAAGLAAGLGFLAAGLALAGLYGMMVYSVQQRRVEIGIRLALGATRRRIAASWLARGARLTALGVLSGLLAGAATAHLARGIVIGVSPHDPVAFGAVGAAVTAVALLACLAPSLAASRTNPARWLRSE